MEGQATQQAHAAHRTVEGPVVACLVFEGVLIGFICCLSRAAAESRIVRVNHQMRK